MTWQAMVKQHREGEAPAAESLYRAALAVEERTRRMRHSPWIPGAVSARAGSRGEAEAMEASASEIRKAQVAQLSPKRQANAQASKVGNGVAAPVLLHKIEPSYSFEARAAKAQGTVVLFVVIGTDGTASDVQLRKAWDTGWTSRRSTPSPNGPSTWHARRHGGARAGLDRGEFRLL